MLSSRRQVFAFTAIVAVVLAGCGSGEKPPAAADTESIAAKPASPGGAAAGSVPTEVAHPSNAAPSDDAGFQRERRGRRSGIPGDPAPGGSPARSAGPGVFKRFDLNEDGQLSADEIPEHFRAQFAECDQDKDGSLSESEFREMTSQMAPPGRGRGEPGQRRMPTAEEILARHDANKDQKLSKEETPAGWEGRFSAADADRDGYLTKDEIDAARGPGRRAGAGGPDRPVRDGGGPRVEEIFDKLDANRSGSITEDEAPAQTWQRIVKADADGDSAVTREELEKARASAGGPGAR